MTTALTIKCDEGIVLASDSQGSTNSNKLQVKKIYGINDYLGLVGAGDKSQIIDTKKEVEHFIKIESNSPNYLRDGLNNCLLKLHEQRNGPYLKTPNQIIDNQFPFTPEILIGAKIKDKEFRIYHGGFGEVGVYKARVPDVFEINEFYYTIGSGRYYALLVLNQQNRLFKTLGNDLSQLPIDINIGIACYVVNEVKDFDIHSGEDIQISIIANDGYKEISLKDQPEYYEKMINNLNGSLNVPHNVLKNMFPVRQSKQL